MICAYSKCNNEFEKFGNKKCCSYAHNTLHWVETHHERRVEISQKYERKKGKIPRIEWAKNMRGKGNPHYTGKATRTNKEDWRKLTKLVKDRDKNKCRKCGKTQKESGMRLAVHHIIPYRIRPEDDIKTLMTLCNSCHHKVEWKIRKGVDFIRALV